MLTLNEQQLKDLEVYLLEIPAKYCNPILNFLAKIKEENTIDNQRTVVKAGPAISNTIK